MAARDGDVQEIIRLLGQGADIDAAAALDSWPWEVSCPDADVRKHYRLQYNTAYSLIAPW